MLVRGQEGPQICRHDPVEHRLLGLAGTIRVGTAWTGGNAGHVRGGHGRKPGAREKPLTPLGVRTRRATRGGKPCRELMGLPSLEFRRNRGNVCRVYPGFRDKTSFLLSELQFPAWMFRQERTVLTGRQYTAFGAGAAAGGGVCREIPARIGSIVLALSGATVDDFKIHSRSHARHHTMDRMVLGLP